jgi:hypothetical protein
MTEEYYRLRGAVINNLPELILDDEDAIVWLTAFRGRWVRNVLAFVCGFCPCSPAVLDFVYFGIG